MKPLTLEFLGSVALMLAMYGLERGQGIPEGEARRLACKYGLTFAAAIRKEERRAARSARGVSLSE